MTRPEAALIDELEFRSYVHNRKQFPDVLPERWAAIFSNVPEMEEQYLDMLSTGNILDVAPQQDSTLLPLASNGAIGFKVEEDGSKQAQLMTGTVGVTQSPWNVPNRPACSPSFDRHGDDRFADNIQRALEGLPQNGDDLEEEAAAEEGALIESSGYNDPATNPRFA